ncbi:hypothetical protein PRIPAC_71948 [Pristionchus pacificus]|uniref:Uncharacterized protein n=1 Tax=Pristionchus pacificus TaxID=54126 RepID=A0A2A6BZV2_PRIPA|nr:hypothetical protein PRIPAC_71948 [Pristionchus pacificus]|eukprot:PDM71376.1 hypothetical protein PRIPAC_37783 [Pristionchus pacificus]
MEYELAAKAHTFWAHAPTSTWNASWSQAGGDLTSAGFILKRAWRVQYGPTVQINEFYETLLDLWCIS